MTQPATPDLSAETARMELPGAAATEALARHIAPMVQAGDVLLLEGQIGAGKTHFARALILARLALAGAPPEDVPSPTFTLVQSYQAGDLEIWHSDLYRLGDPDEIAELGLEAAFDTALCLVEWPDRLGPLAPPDALRLHFEPARDGAARVLHVTPGGPRSRLLARHIANWRFS